MGVGVVLAAVLVAAGVPALACASYLTLLAVASFRRPPSTAGEPHLRLTVLVPAHNEAGTIERCITSLLRQTYPAALTELVVIADNCSDSTAVVARRAGAGVLLRDEPGAPGKGQALRWAFDRVLAQPGGPDAVVVVDADSIADADLLRSLAAAAETASVVQADYQVSDAGDGRSALRAAAFLLFHRTRFLGRAALGMGCALVGNGMLFRREVIASIPWDATSAAEDLEYTVSLRLRGIAPKYAAAARLVAPAPTGGRAGSVQRRRWEGGRFHVARHRLAELTRSAFGSRNWAALDLAIDLATPPLGLLLLLSLLGSALAGVLVVVAGVASWALLPWLAALVLIAVYVFVGLAAARAPRRVWIALAATPWFLALKIATYARLARGFEADRWERTPRDILHTAEEQAVDDARSAADAGERVEISGVPIDVVDCTEAVARMSAALEDASFLQVCTVNLQFLTTARRNPEVREVLTSSGLNVADGAPVVWLGRRLGARLPERVAGADLVPELLREAARHQRRVFLLGGQDGVVESAAAVIERRYPGLMVAGTYEPPHASIDELPTAAILEQVHRSGAEILLAGLGHPKQDVWIHRNRDRLPGCVAIGVGCTLELLASRIQRAPGWMQRHGLEWLYRLACTPRRLAARYAVCAITLLTVLAPAVMLRGLTGSVQPRRRRTGAASAGRVEYAGRPSH